MNHTPQQIHPNSTPEERLYIYHLQRDRASVRHDEVETMVIEAPDENTARSLASMHAGDENEQLWFQITVTCELVGISNKTTPRVICRAFNAG